MNTQHTMRQLMQSAWKLARSGARRFGGKASDYFRMALVLTWKIWRAKPESVYYPGLGAQMWLPGVERKLCVRRNQYVLPGMSLGK